MIWKLLLVMGIFANTTFSQEQKQSVPPKTKVEAFEAQQGAVIIRGFSSAGEVKGVFGGIVKVQSMEFLNATSGKKEYGIAIDVKETDRLERENRSFIDYDEVGALIKGIDYISKIDKTATKLDNFQADYRTKGNLQISTFNSGGETMCSVESGLIGKTSAFLKTDGLLKFREFVVAAKSKLDSIMAPEVK